LCGEVVKTTALPGDEYRSGNVVVILWIPIDTVVKQQMSSLCIPHLAEILCFILYGIDEPSDTPNPASSATNAVTRKFPPSFITDFLPSLPLPPWQAINQPLTANVYIHTYTYSYTMASILRSFSRVAAPLARPSASTTVASRAFTFSAIRKAGGGPPQLQGPGAKAGEVPTE
jgi:hypothetical protein